MKNITSVTYNVFPSNNESIDQPVLENNTDHIDSKNQIVHELLDVEVKHLQWYYQHLLDQSPNHTGQTISNNQCNNESDVTERNEVIEFNVLNSKLNTDIPPLNRVPSCEEKLREIRKYYHDKYIMFTKNKQHLPNHPFRKGACLIVGHSVLAGIDENRKILPRCFYKWHVWLYIKPLLQKLLD